MNRQPWRVLIRDGKVHFFLKRDVSEGSGSDDKPDMQMVDMGIALCHFQLAAQKSGLSVEFCLGDFQHLSEQLEYVGTFTVNFL